MKNSQVLATVFSTQTYEDCYSQWANLQPSVTLVTWCGAGEEVYVKASDWGGSTAVTTKGYFSGALLQRDYA